VRVAGGLLVIAVLASLVGTTVLGALTPLVLGVQLVAVLIGLAGLRVDASWAELRETRLARLVTAALEPPEPPEQED
jgi:formate hydrogenlyase subunit 4